MITGSCLCQKVRYELSEPPQEMSNCHCIMCRKTHGAAYATYARVKASTLSFIAGKESLVSYNSSAEAKRLFCPTCGSPILWQYKSKPEAAWIPAGSFDSDPGIKPSEHIFVTSKAPWHDITDDLEKHDGFPGGFES